MDKRLYKVLRAEDWRAAEAFGVVEAAVDRADGYVHFSTRAQLAGTLEKWFRDAGEVVLLEFDAQGFGDALRWEPARGGALYPHVYAPVRLADAVRRWRLESAPGAMPQPPADLADAGPGRR